MKGKTARFGGRDYYLMDVVCFTDFRHRHFCYKQSGLFSSSLLYFEHVEFACYENF